MIPVNRLLAVVALVAAGTLLTACSASGVQVVHVAPLDGRLESSPTPGPDQDPLGPPTTAPASTSLPVRLPTTITPTDTVPGLTAAIDAASHPSLDICSGHYASSLIERGDLRGTGSTQYLVDTTCVGATESSPDEVAVYQTGTKAIERWAIVYQYTVNRPRLTEFPALETAHTVVLVYADGAQFSLVGITPTGLTRGPLEETGQ